MLAAGAAHAQIVDHPIPLNYNWHGSSRPGEALFSANSFNADSGVNLYRSMADRGLVFDLTDPNSFGTQPIVGNTGLTYSLFNTLGYSNSTWPNAAANGLDTVIIANRLINGNNLELTPGAATNNGPFPAWQPASLVTGLSASAGLVSTSPGVATATTASAHGFRAGDIVLVGGANPSIAANAYTTPHPLNGTYTIASLDATHFTYADSSGNAAASGQRYANNVPASALAVSAGTVTVTTNAPHGLAAGQSVTISGVTPVGYNGVYTIATVPTATTFTYSSATTGTSAAAMLLNNATTITTLTSNTTTVTATATSHGLSTGGTATITGSSIPAYNGTYTVTVPNASPTSITSTTTTATATTATAHPFTNGQAITVTGASNAAHNVTAATITVPSATISYLSGSAGTVTATTSAANTFVNGQLVTISGAFPAAYNGTYTIIVVDTTHFTYSSAATGPMLGTPVATSANVFTYPCTSFSGTSTGATAVTPNVFTYSLVNQGTMLMKPTNGLPGFTGFTGFGYALTSLQGNGAGVITGSTGGVIHGLLVGQSVTISNVLPASYNGTYVIASVPTTTSFTLTDPANNNAATTGTFIGAGTCDRTSTDQVTTLASPITVDANSQLGVAYIGSNSGAPLDVVMTFGTGPSATTFTSRITCPDWCGNTADAAIIAGQNVISQGHFSHPLGAPVYNLSGTGAVITVETGMPHGYAVGNSIIISGETSSGYNGTYSVATVGTQVSATTTATGLTSDGTTGTATFAAAPVFAVGQAIYISNANPATLNGVYVINGVGANTVTFPCTAIGTTTAAATCARNFFTVAGTASGTPAGTVIASNNSVSHPSYRGLANTDATLLAPFGTATTASCATFGNLRVSEAVITMPPSAVGQQLTSVAFRGTTGGVTTAWSSATLNSVVGNGTFAAAATTAAHGLIPGQTFIIKNVTPAAFNGVYTVGSVSDTTHFTFAHATNATATGFGTVERPGSGRGFSIHAATLRTGTAVNAVCSGATPVTTNSTTHLLDLGTTNFFAGTAAPVVTADDTTPVWFSYTAPATGTIKAIFSTCTSSFDTTVAVYTSCGGSPVAVNDDTVGCGTGGSSVSFVLTNSQTYFIRVAGKLGAKGTFTLHIDDTPSPVNSTPGTAAAAIAGTSTAGDNAGTVDHGLVDGFTTIPGATDTIGVWYQRVAAASGVPYTMEARTCLDGQDSALTPLPQVTGVTGVRTVSASSTTVVLPLDTTIAVYAGVPTPSSTPVASNDDGCSVSSRVQWTATPGTVYYIRVGVKAAQTGTSAKFVLHVDDPIHTDLPVPLQFNWNGICHGTTTSGPLVSEQTVPITAAPVIGGVHENRSDVNGYRSIADRGLLFDPNGTTPSALNYGGTIGYQGMAYSVYNVALQNDIVHVGNRNLTGGGTGRPWATAGTLWPAQGGTSTNENGLIPLWLSVDDQRSDQISSVTGLNAVWGPNTKLGFLYHMNNVDIVSGTTPQTATFDVTLTFNDNTSVVVTVQSTDWFGGASANPYNEVLPTPATGSGLEVQRILGIYRATDTTDWGKDATGGPLKVDEAVISTPQLISRGYDPTAHGILKSIGFGNIRSGNAAHDNAYSGLAVYASVLRDPASFNLVYPPSGIGTETPNMLNAGGTGKMTVKVSRGSGTPNNITSVVVDASAIGLSPTFGLNDSATNGDLVANDNTWSRNVSFPITATPNAYSLPFTVTDAQGRTATGNIIFTVVAPTGTFTPSSGVVAGFTTVHAEFIFGTAGGISSIVLDATQLGLSPTLALRDNGTGGDTTANDGTWGANFIPSGTTIPGTYLIPYTVTDTASNTASGTIAITIVPPSGACCTSTTGACAVVVSTSCTGTSQYNGDNTTCATGTPSASCPITGICCNNSAGTCGLLYSGNCGTTATLGTGVVCSAGTPSSSCPISQSCCNGTSGACTFIYGGSCPSGTTASGTATCGVNTCPASGTCCNNTSGVCTLVYGGNACGTGLSGSSGTVCDANTCPVVAVCCNITSGVCSQIYGGLCPSGTLFADGLTCVANITCPPSGTCCNNTTGACTQVYSNNSCPTGTSPGTGTVCDANTCPVVAVCCNATTGVCVQIYGGLCPAGSNLASGTTCDGNTTCPAAGTCCNGVTGACTLNYSGACSSPLTFNASTSCNPTPCTAGPHACENLDGGVTLPVGWTTTSSAAGAPWAIASDQSHSPSNAVFTNDVNTTSSQFLVLPAVTATGTITLDFWSYSSTETNWDGWVVEYSFDGGGTWTDVGVAGWALGGYNNAGLNTSANALTGRPAFSGALTTWTERIAAIPATAGQSVIVRFQMGSDASVAGTGVWLDDICMAGIQVVAPGVCCRGATCSTTYVDAAGCEAALDTTSASVHSKFVTGSATCNTPVTIPGTLGNTTSPCCYANYNHNTTLEVQDIFDFLNDWFAGKKGALVGGNGSSGTLSVQNIFDFLNAWFAGGCS
jgi:hypothetical protein